MSVRHIEYLKLQCSKFLAVEIRPIRCLINTPNGNVRTTKWMNHEHWKDLRVLLSEIADKYEEEKQLHLITQTVKCNDYILKEGKLVRIGYMFVPYSECHCHFLVPREDAVWTDDEDEDDGQGELRDKGGRYCSLSPTAEMLVVSVRLQEQKPTKLRGVSVPMSPMTADKHLVRALDRSFVISNTISDYFPSSQKDSQDSETLPVLSDNVSRNKYQTLKSMTALSHKKFQKRKRDPSFSENTKPKQRQVTEVCNDSNDSIDENVFFSHRREKNKLVKCKGKELKCEEISSGEDLDTELPDLRNFNLIRSDGHRSPVDGNEKLLETGDPNKASICIGNVTDDTQEIIGKSRINSKNSNLFQSLKTDNSLRDRKLLQQNLDVKHSESRCPLTSNKYEEADDTPNKMNEVPPDCSSESDYHIDVKEEVDSNPDSSSYCNESNTHFLAFNAESDVDVESIFNNSGGVSNPVNERRITFDPTTRTHTFLPSLQVTGANKKEGQDFSEGIPTEREMAKGVDKTATTLNQPFCVKIQNYLRSPSHSPLSEEDSHQRKKEKNTKSKINELFESRPIGIDEGETYDSQEEEYIPQPNLDATCVEETTQPILYCPSSISSPLLKSEVDDYRISSSIGSNSQEEEYIPQSIPNSFCSEGSVSLAYSPKSSVKPSKLTNESDNDEVSNCRRSKRLQSRDEAFALEIRSQSSSGLLSNSPYKMVVGRSPNKMVLSGAKKCTKADENLESSNSSVVASSLTPVKEAPKKKMTLGNRTKSLESISSEKTIPIEQSFSQMKVAKRKVAVVSAKKLDSSKKEKKKLTKVADERKRSVKNSKKIKTGEESLSGSSCQQDNDSVTLEDEKEKEMSKRNKKNSDVKKSDTMDKKTSKKAKGTSDIKMFAKKSKKSVEGKETIDATSSPSVRDIFYFESQSLPDLSLNKKENSVQREKQKRKQRSTFSMRNARKVFKENEKLIAEGMKILEGPISFDDSSIDNKLNKSSTTTSKKKVSSKGYTSKQMYEDDDDWAPSSQRKRGKCLKTEKLRSKISKKQPPNQPTLADCLLMKSLTTDISTEQIPRRPKRRKSEVLYDLNLLYTASTSDEENTPSDKNVDSEHEDSSLSISRLLHHSASPELDLGDLPSTSTDENTLQNHSDSDSTTKVMDSVFGKLGETDLSFNSSKDDTDWMSGLKDGQHSGNPQGNASCLITGEKIKTLSIEDLKFIYEKIENTSSKELLNRIEECDQYMCDIIKGRQANYRHELFKKDFCRYYFSELMYGPFSEDQIELVTDQLKKKYIGLLMETNWDLQDSRTYIWKVLCPSFFIKLVMENENCDEKESEQILEDISKKVIR